MTRPWLAALLLLAGCATDSCPPPKPIIQTVNVPIPTPCAVEFPAVPDFWDSKARIEGAKGPDEMAALYTAGRLQRIRYAAELKAALAACKG